MNKTIAMTLALLCASVQGTWAQYVDYVDHVLDGTTYVETVETAYPTSGLSSNYNPLDTDWYDLREDVTFTDRLVINGDVKIILRKGLTLTAECGIYVTPGSKLTIYEQWKPNDSSEGILIAKGNDGNAGIGGNNSNQPGEITIHGGNIKAVGGKEAAGIGGGRTGKGGTVNIFGGTIEATGGEYGAGIGGGKGDDSVSGSGNQGGDVNIYGGEVNATGMCPTKFNGKGGAGIGGGASGFGNNVNIYGGTVRAISRGDGAGIGGGSDRDISGDCMVLIAGGQVSAFGYDPTASDHSIWGGAGIGGGAGGDQGNGTVTIYDGSVIAFGGAYAAGIGGGDSTYGGGKGGKVNIYGGQVKAVCGNKCDPSKDNGGCAIGSASGIDKREYAGSLFINDLMKVHYGNGDDNLYAIAPSADRVGYCRSNVVVKIEPCDHLNNLYYDNINGTTHRLIECEYCLLPRLSEFEHNFEYFEGLCECGLFALADDGRYSETISGFDGQKRPVVLSDRTLFKDGSWNTLCLPFDLESFSDTPLEDATVMELNNSEGCDTRFDEASGTLYLDFVSASKIEAGHAYIVKWEPSTEDVVNPMFTNVKIKNADPASQSTTSPDGYVTFVGTYNPVVFGEEGDKTKLYLGAGNTLYYPSGAMSINAQRAYFQLNNGLTAGEPTSSSTTIKAFSLNFGDEEMGIEKVNGYGLEVNGYGPGWYTPDGRRIGEKPTTKGLYIHNGQKVLIK